MTDRELMQQALDVLICCVIDIDAHWECRSIDQIDAAGVTPPIITALRDRLAHCDRCGKRLGGEGDIHTCSPDPIGDAQDRLIAELAAQPEQHPVAFVNADHLQGLTLGHYGYAEIYTDESEGRVPIYTTPPAAAPVQPVAWVSAVTGDVTTQDMSHTVSWVPLTTLPAAAQPAQQELVGREAYMAIREARENASEDAYFAARPEHDKDLNRLMFRSGFYHGYPTTPPAAAQPAPVQEPYGWVQPNPSFNSGIFNQGAECPSGWVGSAIAVHTAPPTAQQIDEAYAVGYSNGMTEGYEAGKAYAAAQHQCKWPNCQSEEYQQALAEQISQELVTGAAQWQWVDLTDDDLVACSDSQKATVLYFMKKLKEKNT